ncbi:hypothetical protein [Roseomonas marmotae]|uniref:Post-segregation antitoxin CcdA n=1 Tax=Roseomonas marmotae TaxID=2768161 RepID=A0ABS3KEN1_9PROT|nr:hypothetical protein [Roseomonas marmotae]MBO1075885.1 hypothetical protein [Roseomonas marmotae]QTI81928.1 hypothetical protein IAI58_21575 [Roseomonas marmotae]
MDSKLIDIRGTKKIHEDAVAAARRERESAAYAELAEMNVNWNSWGEKPGFLMGSYRPH